MKLKIIASLILIFLNYNISAKTAKFTPVKRFDVDEVYTNPLMFLTTATLDTPLGKELRSKGTTTSPAFIVYEGNHPMIELAGRETPMVKKFKMNSRTGSLEKVFSAPLNQADNTLTATLYGNALLVQDTGLAELDNWPLNQTVSEVHNSDLTFLQVQVLLNEKYGWSIPDGFTIPQFGHCPEEIVMSKTEKPVTVRELIMAMLTVAARNAYAKTDYDSWIVIYKIGKGPQQTVHSPRTFTITQPVHR